jgi:hypothetical protein
LRFTTNAYPREQRQDAWRFALRRVSLEVQATSEDLYGELVSFTSGQGIQFVRVTGNGQSLAIDMAQEAPSFWLVLLLEGRLSARQGTTTIDLAEGDILYGGGASRTQVDLAGEHRFLLVKVPHALPALRSRSALPSQISNLIADEAIGRMLSALLRSVADTIVDVSDDQIRPVELALPEFIAATLLDKAPVKELGARRARARRSSNACSSRSRCACLIPTCRSTRSPPNTASRRATCKNCSRARARASASSSSSAASNAAASIWAARSMPSARFPKSSINGASTTAPASAAPFANATR